MRPPSDLPPRRPRARRFRFTSKWRIAIIAVVVLLVVLLLSAKSLASFYVDVLWFDSVGRKDVFWSILRAKILLGIGCSLMFAVATYISLAVADRVAPTVRPSGIEEEVLDRVRAFVEPRQRLLRAGVAVLFGIIAGIPAASHWQEWLLFRNSVKFGIKDPQFHEDVSWYVFRLPFLNFFIGWLFASVLVVTLLTAVAHYLNGGIRTTGPAPHVTPQVKLHISLLLAALAVLKAAQYWLRRYSLTISDRGFAKGAGYTDVKAQLPALNLLILISLAAAVLLVLNVRQRGWRLPVIAVGLWAVVSLVAGTIYPAVIQKFRVEPSLSSRETPYVQRNIEMTRAAFGIGKAVETPTPVTYLPVTTQDVATSLDTLSNVRLLDPKVDAIKQAFTQQKRLDGSFYQFADLDVDRYVVDGTLQQLIVAARVVADGKSLPNKSWEATHLGYTHGHGLVAAPASRVLADGLPAYLADGDNFSSLGVTRPEIYFADGMPGSYVVANSSRAGGETGPNGTSSSYEGHGGVRISNVWRRLSFALKFGEYNLFGSRLIEQDSRIMWVRDVRARVAKLAPFLSLDSDPYPVALPDGRIVWVVDAYTTTSHYPYSESGDTAQLDGSSGLRRDFNYVRNSVKAVVDAYEGTVDLYLMDPLDPIAVAWANAFPGLMNGKDELPPGLEDHLRYPEDLLRVQTAQIGKYQLGDATGFFEQNKRWCVTQNVPDRQTKEGSTPALAAQPAASGTQATASSKCAASGRYNPYYTIFTPPESETSEFALIRPFAPFSTDDGLKALQAFVAGTVGPDLLPKMTLYTVQGVLPAGPYAVHLQIQQALAAVFTLEGQEGSEILFGDMQIVNVGQGLVWVRPVYIKASSGAAVPNLKYVVVYGNDEVVESNSLSSALNVLFPGADVDLGDRGPDGSDEPPDSEPPPDNENTVEELLDAATKLFAEANAALAAGDLGVYQQKVDEAMEKVAQADALLAPTTTTTTPSTTTPPTTTGG